MSARGQDLMDISQDSRLSQLSMAHKDEPDGKGGASEIQELLDWNNLIYTMPVTNSVVAARNIKSYRSDIASYTMGQTIEFRVQTGSQFVDWKNSWITLDLEFKVGTAAYTNVGWGEGSAFNLIRDVVVSSRSGAELQRIELFNQYRVTKDRTTRDGSWFDSTGSLCGYTNNQTQNPAISADIQINEELKKSFCLPMSMFEGVFAADQLCPSYLASGMRIELRLMDALEKCIKGTGANVTLSNVKIDKAELFVDTYMLNDAAMIELKKVSAQNGLEYVYTSIYSQNETISTPKVNMTVTKSVSRALSAFAIRKPAIVSAVNGDGFTTASSCIIDNYQWRLGSQYYPHQKIEGTRNAYLNHKYTTDTLWKDTSVSVTKFRDEHAVASSSFERSNLLRYSGAPINNSRVLSFDGTYGAAVAGEGHLTEDTASGSTPTNANDVTIYLEYVTVAKVFLNNVVVTL